MKKGTTTENINRVSKTRLDSGFGKKKTIKVNWGNFNMDWNLDDIRKFVQIFLDEKIILCLCPNVLMLRRC